MQKNQLILFVEHFSKLYSPKFITYNLHAVIHLAEDVKMYGNLDQFSAFPFENFLGCLKKLVRKPNFVLEQIISRLQEKSMVEKENDQSGRHAAALKKQHVKGPLPNDSLYLPCLEYGEATLGTNTTISTSLPDNCIKLDEDICLIDNIIKCQNGIYVICRKFQQKQSLFNYP